MDRRDFLKVAGTVAAATLDGRAAMADTAPGAPALAIPALAKPALAGARHWVVALPQSLDTLEVRTVLTRLQHQVQQALPQTTLTIEATVSSGLEAAATGLADLYVGIDTQHAATHAALPVFAGLPLGLDLPAAAHHGWLVGPGRGLWDAALDAAGAVAMPFAHTGPSAGLYTDTAFAEARDFAGTRIAVRGLAGDALRLLGADVSDHDADGRGAIAARGLVATEPLLTPFEAKASWSYQPGLTPGGLTISLGARGSFWRRLSASEQALIASLAAAAFADSIALGQERQATLAHVAAYRRWPVATDMPAGFERDMRRAITAVIDDLRHRDPLARRALDSYRNYSRQVG